GVADDEERKAGMLEKVHPGSTLHPAQQTSAGYEYAGKHENERDHDKCGEEIGARHDEGRAGTHDGELRIQEQRSDRIAQEHRRYIGRNKGIDSARVGAFEGTEGDQDKYDRYATD